MTSGIALGAPSLAAMLLRKTARVITAAALLVGAGGMGLAAPASACACGGIAAPADGAASVAGETAALSWDGQRETILMRLSLQSQGTEAALLVPTPTPATVSAGKAATFTALRAATAPEVITDRRWFGDSDADGAVAGGAPGAAAPTVLGQVQLGPLEATTLSGGDITGVQTWLRDNGYVMKPEVVATMSPYLAAGWSFVAIRLTGSEPLSGALDPVRLSFAADRLVYPMRMSSAATTPQTVRLYVLGEHRVQRADADAARQSVSVQFAGRLGHVTDPDLAQLASGGRDYLTELYTYVSRPADITSDFTFADTADTDYRATTHRTEYIEFLGVPAGFVIIGAALATLFAVVLAVASVLRRTG